MSSTLLIDWFLELPKQQQRQLQIVMNAYEKEHNMPYMTSTERMAREEELLNAIAGALESKFGDVGVAFARELQDLSDLDKLREILHTLLRGAPTIDQLRSKMQ